MSDERPICDTCQNRLHPNAPPDRLIRKQPGGYCFYCWERTTGLHHAITLTEPGLEPQPMNEDDYMECMPEKAGETCDGYLMDPPDDPERREKLLRLLLVNVGLRRAVQLAPKELWEQALGES